MTSKFRLIAAIAALTIAATVAPGANSPLAAQGYGYDCAHGPDTYRVRGVASWDRLNMRARASARSHIVGAIPPQGSGVHCLGPCYGNWCKVSWRGMIGYVNMRYLGE